MHLWSLPQGKESCTGATVARLGWAVKPWAYQVWLPFFMGFAEQRV